MKQRQLKLRLFSKAGQSQGLLYKHLHHSLIHSLSDPLVPTALWRHHTQTVKDSSSSYKIDYRLIRSTGRSAHLE